MNLREWKQKFYDTLQDCFGLPVAFGFERPDHLFSIRDTDFVYVDHAYFERGYDKANFRCILNGVHQVDVCQGLPDRTKRLAPFPRPWQQGDDVIVIPPPTNLCRWHNAYTWTDDAVAELKKHTDRKIVVKPKSGPPLSELSCWAVVSHSSVAAVEAAYMGIPVFGPDTSPAYKVGLENLGRIEDPNFPDRSDWVNTLCWSQFSIDEITSGFAWEVLRNIHGAKYAS